MKMDLNTKNTIRLSLSDIEEYRNLLNEKKENLSKIGVNIVTRASEVGLENNYSSTELIPVVVKGTKITGGIRTTDPKDTYREFGTGIVGSNNPHVSEYLAKVGWKYDVNQHGEKGWVYPKGDGTFGWTKGLPAEKKFYEAMLRMEESLSQIAIDEIRK